jgi:hypothetical protein
MVYLSTVLILLLAVFSLGGISANRRTTRKESDSTPIGGKASCIEVDIGEFSHDVCLLSYVPYTASELAS